MSMGEYGRLPGYPGAMSAVAQPSLGQVRWAAARLTAAVLTFVGAVLALVGTFLPLYSGRLRFGSQSQDVTVTAWAATSDSSSPTDAPANGIPLVFATIFLIVAAVLCWFAANPGSTPGTNRLAGLLTSVGTAFLIGTVWTVLLQVVSSVDQVITLANNIPGLGAEATYRVGFWLLLVAGIVSLAGSVLALMPTRQPQWAPQQPMAMGQGIGMASATPLQAMHVPTMTVLPPTTAVPQPTFQVDPLTGRPLTQGPYGPPPGTQSAPNGFPIPQSSQYAVAPQNGAQTQNPAMPAANVPFHYGGPRQDAVPFQPAPNPVPFQAIAPSPYGVPDVPIVYALPPEEPPQAPSAPPVQEAVPAPAPATPLPDAPPAPASPPGPAVPATEDPLAEPRQP